jgi:hypothetical protein
MNMKRFPIDLPFAIASGLIALALTAPAQAADPNQQSLAATQSAIRDIRDRTWERPRMAAAPKEQFLVAPRQAPRRYPSGQ